MTVELQNQLNEKNEEITLLVSQISASIQNQEELEKELETRQLQLNTSDEQLKQLRIQLTENTNIRVQILEDQLNQSRTELQTEKDQHNQSKQEQETKLNIIQKQMNDLQKKLQDIIIERDQYKCQYLEQYQLNRKYESQYNQLHNKYYSETQNNLDNIQKLIQSQNLVSELNRTLAQYFDANQNLAHANNDLNQQVQQLQSQKCDLTKQINVAHIEVNQSRSQIETLRQQKEESNIQLAQSKFLYEANIIQLQNQHHHTEELANSQLESRNTKIQQQEADKIQLQEQLNEFQTQITALKLENELLNKKLKVKPEIVDQEPQNIHINFMNFPKRSRTVRINTKEEQIENMILYIKENGFNAQKENKNVVIKYTEAENIRLQQVIDHIKKELDVEVTNE
ncbi:Hypothetical_protein [Hexamita inflata]|uniref:Hypothetical_protein n=1 Tax=Hexamita inflata TaxID=28002 RepID=A0AA86NSX1_9EUKA|nr:Hypothetical protein HINF_LOCUS12577 [Hexamita inflata]